ncbi:hypothetical protein [Amycolatopsis sp. H20-H5]|uniref:hypothetical protein n=1 Tax=Amycolatopsis sp. H20-H5 TaxID=3046309 RepID=UPI002DB9F4DB|nr:hypothetical protein [Amycolatopsis sp. H20-H5]MEC3978093.1 hypothetical protein [Amycolatopsis sp. H20-H5]
MDTRACRYRVRDGPVATGTAMIGKVAVAVHLLFQGELDVRLPASGDRSGTPKLLFDGRYVSGLDIPAATVSSAAGHRFTPSARTFRAPGTAVFHGRCEVDARRDTLTLSGKLDNRLEVRAGWNSRVIGAAVPESAAQWCEAFGAPLAAIGGMVLCPSVSPC